MINKKIIKWAAVAAFNGTVGLLLFLGAELLLRRHFSPAAVFEGESHYRFHELLGWEPKPGKYVRDYGTVTISDEGFRECPGQETGVAAGSILVCGDSFTFGSFVSDEGTWPCQLSSLLGRRVINAGVSGYGLDQIFLRARREIENLEPGLMIVSLIPDDIHRCIMSRRIRNKPYFEVACGRLFLHQVPVSRPFFRRPASRWYERSLLLWLLVRALQGKVGEEIEYTDNDAREISRLLFQRMCRLAQARSIPLVVIFKPESPQLPQQPWETGLILKEFLRESGAVVLDLHPSFRESFPAAEKRRELFSARGHLSGEGNRWVAERVAAFLKSQNLLGRVESLSPSAADRDPEKF